MAHVFRFFVDEVGAAGAEVRLAADDAAHLRVLRASAGTRVEVVDAAAVTWVAEYVEGATVRLLEPIAAGEPGPGVALVAGALTGQAWDTLVDNAVQAGVASIAPLVSGRRDRERIAARAERATRVARAAAKQAKRALVPELADPLGADSLSDADPGIVVAIGSHPVLTDVPLEGLGDPVTLLVGGAEGLELELVADLVDRGWVAASLGPTVLRSELAAAVAVSILVQRLRPAG